MDKQINISVNSISTIWRQISSPSLVLIDYLYTCAAAHMTQQRLSLPLLHVHPQVTGLTTSAYAHQELDQNLLLGEGT